ncbi:HNH endonuclease [Orbus wheelerorum]|uniref:HNH endonuclease n=1 Tax=Orbus wheelerorum TaxID=3074111 RepID=UPI00370D0CA0
MDIKQLKQQISDIKIWKKEDQSAPHKPLLLLYVLSQYKKGHDRLFNYGSEIKDQLSELLIKFGPQRADYYPNMPFWRLQKEAFWQLTNIEDCINSANSNKDPSSNQLINCQAYGGFDEQTYQYLKADSNVIAQLVWQILCQYFPKNIQSELINKLDFSPITKIDDLILGSVLNNKELCEIFACSPQSGMRKSNATKTLVLITNHIESVYSDVWNGNILYYTGMGQKGDQRLDFMQNRTLNEIESNGIKVHYFEVFKDKEYTYMGQLLKAGEPYQTEQLGSDKKLRKAWIFPLKLTENSLPIMAIFRDEETKERKIHKYSDQKLLAKIQKQNKKPGKRDVATPQYIRSSELAEFVKRKAKGLCDLCHQTAPFFTQDNIPYLECHHIVWLSQGGDDALKNTVALCPNCHRKMHIVKDEQDINALIHIAEEREQEVIKSNG